MTKNFKIHEFNCSCGCNMPLEVYENVIKLSGQLQKLRDYTGRAITVNSAYRCEDHNRKCGGSSRSQHLLGKAADITIESLKPAEVVVIINDLIDIGELLQGGVGSYDNFTHYDIRKTKARWNG